MWCEFMGANAKRRIGACLHTERATARARSSVICKQINILKRCLIWTCNIVAGEILAEIGGRERNCNWLLCCNDHVHAAWSRRAGHSWLSSNHQSYSTRKVWDQRPFKSTSQVRRAICFSFRHPSNLSTLFPDFDDDDYSSTPLFGRSQPGGLWGPSNSGQDSPTILTPLAERSEKGNFHAHARGDSVASEDSAHSIQYTSRKLKTPFAHSAQSSVATTSSSPFTKKSSFASLRNAFKSNKAFDPPPPMPTLDQQAYPVFKNPFNRSATSLAHGGVLPRDRPSVHASPTQFRPSTPNSSDFKFRRTPSSKYRGHSYAKSQHSHSGSIFHFSDGGSDHGHGFSFGALSTPPPVPPVPNPFGIPMPLSESPDLEEERVVVEARTPSEFALHAIFIRFAASAESLMNDFVGRSLVCLSLNVVLFWD